MAERRVADAAVERALVEVGARLAFPPTPDLSVAVRARLAAGPPRRPAVWAALGSRPRLAMLLAGAVVMLLAGAVVMLLAALLGVSPGARDAVADWLGMRGVRFFSSAETPTVSPTPPAASTRSALLGGTRVSLETARERVAFPLRLPALPGLEAPDEVYLNTAPAGGVVSLLYEPRPALPEARDTGIGLLLTQFRGTAEPFIQQGLPAGARLEPVSVGGARGYWIEGAPHVLIYRDERGAVHEERARLAGNTLLWERDGITYRLEAALARDDAIAVAVSLR